MAQGTAQRVQRSGGVSADLEICRASLDWAGETPAPTRDEKRFKCLKKTGTGTNGKRVGLLERVKAGVKEDVQSLKTDMPAKAKDQIEGLKDPTKTQVYTSIFRHKHDDTPRNRALGVLSNVFLHLHPAKINRDAVRYSYTWGMGGITFYLFIVLTLTGVMLMFYYHPSKVQAFRDVLYLEHDVPFGKLLRNMHRWAAHLMVIAVWLHMFRVFLTGLV